MTQSQTRGPVLLDYIPEDDGYTLDAYIAGRLALHNPVRITYRPTDSITRAVLVNVVQGSQKEREILKHLAAYLQTRIVSWSIQEVTEGVTRTLPITAANLLRLKPFLWERLCDIVIWGRSGGDADPSIPKTVEEDEFDEEFAAVLAGSKPVDAKVETLQGNSEPG
jgi:hypothetical protein